MKKSLRYIVAGIVVLLVGGFVIADTVNQEKQLLVDGDMEDTGVITDIWTAASGATLTKESGAVNDGSQVLRVRGGAWCVGYQTVLTSGNTYRVTGWVRGDGGTGRGTVGGISPDFNGTTANVWQYIDVVGEASATQIFLYQAGAGGNDYVEFDDILVTEYTPPIVNNEEELLVDGDMEEDGTDIPFIKKFDLTQAVNITADSGAITGALTYACAGAEFDGTNDYVTYTIPTTLFSTSPKISIVAEFTPDFDWDEDVQRVIMDSVAGNGYLIYKTVNASGNVLNITLGDTALASITSATYSAYWNQNARNVLVVSGTSGATNAWLNGTQIKTNDATAWSPIGPTSFCVGALCAGTFKFDGEIHAISIYSGLLDGTDATNLYNSVDTSDWNVSASACLTKQLGGVEDEGQVLRVAYGGENNPAARYNIAGARPYRVTGWMRGDGTVAPQIYIGGLLVKAGTNSTSWQYFDTAVDVIAGGTTLAMFAMATGAGEYAEFDDVLVTEYTPPMVNDYDQLVVGGDMEEAGVASWSVGASATLTKPTGEGAEDGTQILKVARNSAANPFAYQTIFTIGDQYRITGWTRSDGNATPSVFQDDGLDWNGTTSTSWQYFDEVFTCGAGDMHIRLRAVTDTGTEYVEFDDVFVTLVEPQYNHYGQILVDGDMEEDGTDIFFSNKFDLTQAANITADSGSITGALTYTCEGAEFDGTNDYVTYTIAGTLFSTKSSISIVVEFTPDFDWDDDNNTYLFDSTSTERYYIFKRDNGDNNTLKLVLGGAVIGEVASATYSGDWNVDARNVLVISGTSGDTNIWLNGTQIMTNNAIAWTPAEPIILTVGSNFAGGNKFDGEIHAVSIYSGLLDGTDAQNLYDSVDTDDWTVVNNACLTKQLGASGGGSQIIRVAYDDADVPYIYQDILTVGQEYRFTGWARGDGTHLPRVASGSAGILWDGTTSTSWQYFDVNGTSNHTWFYLQSQNNGVGYVEFDDVVVTRSD